MILQYPHEILLKKSNDLTKEHVQIFLPHFKSLVEKYKNIALGLAAPQTGLNYNLIWTRNGGFMINPKLILKEDSEQIGSIESCLSIESKPRKFFAVQRYKKISVVFKDENFKTVRKSFSGEDAIVIQHEIDHLHGKTLYETGKEIDVVRPEEENEKN